jgi:hypothetical protein
VRLVLHNSLPSTLEAYYQEAGRAGRDGLPARAVMLYSPKDTALHEFFIENDSPTAPELRAVHTLFLRQPLTAGFTLEELENATGLSQIKARVALQQLQAAGALLRAPDTAFGRKRAEAQPLSETALQTISSQVDERREHKRDQLARMVDYAETSACRRRTLLDHFGDSGPAEAPICCDNCLSRAETPEEVEARPAETQSERGALIVLDTLAHLRWGVGGGKLAQLLKGSNSKDLALYKDARNFGKFAALRMSEIESVIGQLLDGGYLKQVGGGRPTLSLTTKGQNALQARAAIPVNLRPVRPAAAQRAQAKAAASGTVLLSGQMLARGLTPEQMAAERGLTIGTIHSHLAQLISEGKVDVNAVVPTGLQVQIRAAIDAVGSAEFLAPIKARLPAEIEYDVIRCVANAWKLETGAVSVGNDRASQVHAWGESGSLEHVPELVAALTDSDGNVRRLAASALGKLRTSDAVEPLCVLLDHEPGPQVRQYAIKALRAIGDQRARATLERIAASADEIEYNRGAAQAGLAALRRRE